MKKFLYGMMAATMIFATSCENELELGAAGEESIVSFTISTPDMGSRAEYSDGTTATVLQYAVYDAAGNLLPNLTVTNAKINGSAEVKLKLTTGNSYSVIFWAAAPSTTEKPSPYTVDFTNKTMTVDYNGAKSNDESRDAFYKYHTFTVNGAQTETIELRRPFAQLNIGTNDYAESKKAGYVPTSSSVTVKNIYNTLDLVEGKVSGDDKAKVFASAAIPVGQEFPVAGYEYLAMNYLLVGADKETVDVEFTYTNGTNAKTRTVGSVPVQRNHRTNIYGALLTSEVDINVEIKPEYETPDNIVYVWDGSEVKEPKVSDTDANVYEIEFASELAWLAAAVNGTLPENSRSTVAANSFKGKTFKLTKDIDLGGKEWTPIGDSEHIFKGTFDGQDKVVKNLVITGNNSNVGLFAVTHDGEIKNFTVENAKVSGRLNVGVVAGQPYTSKYTDITVRGHVEVNGMAYVGGVGGKNAYADWTNITVDVDNNSYVKANSVENGTAYRTYVGGVCGFNGEGGHSFKNITSNINVKGSTCDVGGLFGIAHYGNKFENCVCTGNVEIYAAKEKAEAQEIGGIAGVWHNGGENVVLTRCSFDGELTTTNIEGVDFYYGGLVGAPYSATGNGKLIIDGKQYVASAAQLQAAINAAEGETTLYLGYDIDGDVTVVQKPGVKITIDGDGKKYNGTIKVHSNSNYYTDAALTIKNVNFETSAASVNVIEALENGSERYSSNITVDECTFTATSEAVKTAVGVQVKATRGVTVKNCTATDMHSLIQAQSCDETVVVNGCTINGKNGVAFKQVKAATVDGTTITALEYGIRFDGNIDNYGIVVKNNNVTAVQPLIVRKMTGKNNTIALEGTNNLTTEAEYQIVITNGSDDEAYVKPTGTYTLTGADNFTIFPGPPPVAKVGNTEYSSIDEAIANWTNNATLTLLNDVTLTDVITLKSTEHHILNLGTYTMTAAEGKDAIEVTCNGRSSASYALTVNADATNPGGITATGKSCIYYKKSDSTKDRPIILINNGVFTGSYSINSISNGNTNCPQIWINGGIFNSYMNLTKNMLRVSGGTFHGAINCTGDSSAYREIKGGRFKSWQFMTADAPNKFWVGNGNGNYNVGVYVDDEGYLVVGGPVITDFGDKFAAKATNYSKWSSYLKYSSAAANGLYYTNADMAIKKHGEANVVLK